MRRPPRAMASPHVRITASFIHLAVLICLLNTLPDPCRASIPDTLWTRVYGAGAAYSVVQTHDGGFAAAGFVGSGDGYTDQMCLIRVGSSGEELWRRIYPGTAAYALVENHDHGFLLAGYEYRPYLSPMRVIRTNSNGDTLWTRSYELKPVRSALQLDDDSFVIAGSSYIMKLDPAGNQLWFRDLSTGAISSIYSLATCRSGGFVLAGNIRRGTIQMDVWLIRTSDSGDTVWTRRYTGSGSHHAYSIREVSTGGFVFSGRQGNDMFWAARTNSDGDTLWTCSEPQAWEGFSITETDGGQFAATGVTTSPDYDLALIRLGPDGTRLGLDELAGVTYGGKAWEIGYSIERTSDNGLLLAGWRDCIPTEGGYCDNGQFWLARVAPPGTSGVDGISGPLRLRVNHPNPFQTITTIEYEVRAPAVVRVGIYDASGRLISTIATGRLEAGKYSRVIDLSDRESGVYFVRLTDGRNLVSRKLTVIH